MEFKKVIQHVELFHDSFGIKNHYEPNFTEEWLGTWYFKKEL